MSKDCTVTAIQSIDFEEIAPSGPATHFLPAIEKVKKVVSTNWRVNKQRVKSTNRDAVAHEWRKAPVCNIALKPRPKAKVFIVEVCNFFELLNLIVDWRYSLNKGYFRKQGNALNYDMKVQMAQPCVMNYYTLFHCTIIMNYTQCVIHQDFRTTARNKLVRVILKHCKNMLQYFKSALCDITLEISERRSFRQVVTSF